jgi:hypothetical protein
MTVVIGSQNDVPDIGDPIVSPWYQDTARKIVHQFASTTARDAWTNPPNGAMCVTTDTGTTWLRRGGVWQIPGPRLYTGTASAVTVPPAGALTAASVAAVPAGQYFVSHTVLVASTAPLQGNLKLYGPLGVIFYCQFNTGSAAETWTLATYIDIATSSALNVQIENNGAANITSYSSGDNHRIFALAVSL